MVVKKQKIVEAGIGQGTFYFYFPSKFSVMSEIAKSAVEEIMKEIRASMDSSQSFDKNELFPPLDCIGSKSNHKED